MKHNIFEGFFFWILSILVLIPGGYYSFQFYKAKRAKSETERKETRVSGLYQKNEESSVPIKNTGG